jgi:hypothetical protein
MKLKGSKLPLQFEITLFYGSQTPCPLHHRTSDISCSWSACHTSMSKSLTHKILLILAGLEPAIF